MAPRIRTKLHKSRNKATRRTVQSRRANRLVSDGCSTVGTKARARPIGKSTFCGTAQPQVARGNCPGVFRALRRFNAFRRREFTDKFVRDHMRPTRKVETRRLLTGEIRSCSVDPDKAGDLPAVIERIVTVPTTPCSVKRRAVVGVWIAIAHSK